MNKLARIITRKIINEGIGDAYKEAIYVYGIEMIMQKNITVLIIFIAAEFMNKTIEALLFIISLSLIKGHAGGFHFSSSRVCAFTSFVIYIAILFCSEYYFNDDAVEVFILMMISAVIIAMIAPVNHKNMHFTDDEMNKCRTVTLRRDMELILLSSILMLTERCAHLAIYSVMAMFICAISLVFGKLLNNGRYKLQ